MLRSLFALIPVAAIGIAALYFLFFHLPLQTGDLGQHGKITFGKDYDRFIRTPDFDDNVVTEFAYYSDNGDSIDVFSFGDSYSQQEILGYQNYLGHRLGKSIVNLNSGYIYTPNIPYSPPQRLVELLKEGFFDTLKIKTIILENVERFFPTYMRNLTFSPAEKPTILFPEEYMNIYEQEMPFRQNFIDWVKISLGMDENPAYSARLNANYFTHPELGSSLFFTHEELLETELTEEEAAMAAAKLDSLKALVESHGMQLVYLVAPDKYEVYQDVIADNPYPRKRLGEQIGGMAAERDWMVYPLDKLKAAVARGEQDIYMLHDTHWSRHSSRIVADILFPLVYVGKKL